MEDKSEAKYLKKLQDERDVIILKKLELCEALDDGQKEELSTRFRNYPEALNELTQLRQEHNQLLGKMGLDSVYFTRLWGTLLFVWMTYQNIEKTYLKCQEFLQYC